MGCQVDDAQPGLPGLPLPGQKRRGIEKQHIRLQKRWQLLQRLR